MRLRVIGPKSWTHGSKVFSADAGEKPEGYEIASADFFPAQSSRYLVPSLPLHLWRFRPDTLYIMEELDRLSLFLNALIAKLAWPRVRIISYSLQNIERPSYHRFHHRLALRLNRLLVSKAAAASREAAEVLRAQSFRG